MRKRLPRVPGLVAALVCSVIAACSGSPSGPTQTPPPPPPPNPQTAVLLAAGDIGMCGSQGTELTAQLIDRTLGTLVLAGDIAYLHGSAQDFARCFHPFWGRFNTRWYAVPGNHEYETSGAQPFFDYFGEAAGEGGQGFFSFFAGDWLVLMLNSNISSARNSPQGEFVRQQLESRRPRCSMAVWHHPLYSSGPNGPTTQMRDLWSALEAAGNDLVVNAHDHLYERFGRQNAEGRLHLEGMRQFTVGTGGAELYRFAGVSANSESRLSTFGVLRLTLMSGSYRWEFLSAPNGTIEDSGTENCRP
jgi:Calcineurin-like phosphoesterase